MPSTHARYSPSGIYAGLVCPAMYKNSDGKPEQTSEYADEGTEAHSYGEKAIIKRVPVAEICDDKEMAEYVQYYVDVVESYRNKFRFWGIEKRLTYNEELFGTIDFIAWDDDQLVLIDLKYGAGVSVSAVENKQLMTYAAMAMVMFGIKKKVTIIIVQPRLDNPLRVWETDSETINNHFDKVLDMINLSKLDNPPGKAGDHCRWCRAKIDCPIINDAKDRVMKANLSETNEINLGQLLSDCDAVEQQIKAIRALAYETADNGGKVDGYKLVAKRAVRKWSDEKEAVKKLESCVDNVLTLYDTKLKSPAKLEKIIPKEILQPLVTKSSSGTTLVPESDKRPAIASSNGVANLAEAIKASTL